VDLRRYHVEQTEEFPLFFIFFDLLPPQVDFLFFLQFGIFHFYVHVMFFIFLFFFEAVASGANAHLRRNLTELSHFGFWQTGGRRTLKKK